MSTKTKYVKVPVSERLPEKSGFYFIIKPNSHFDKLKATYFSVNTEDFGDGKDNEAEFWLEEKEDHSEEMLSMLEDCLKSLEYVYKNARIKTTSEGYEDEIENILYRKQELEILINKVKDNGK